MSECICPIDDGHHYDNCPMGGESRVELISRLMKEGGMCDVDESDVLYLLDRLEAARALPVTHFDVYQEACGGAHAVMLPKAFVAKDELDAVLKGTNEPG